MILVLNFYRQAFHRYALNYINALNYLETVRRHQEFSEFEKVQDSTVQYSTVLYKTEESFYNGLVSEYRQTGRKIR